MDKVEKKIAIQPHVTNQLVYKKNGIIDILIKHFLHDVKKRSDKNDTSVDDFVIWFYSADPFSGVPDDIKIQQIMKEKSRFYKIFLGDLLSTEMGDYEKEFVIAGEKKVYKNMDDDRKIKYFTDYYNKVKPTIHIDKINEKYYYEVTEETINNTLAKKPYFWKIYSPAFKYKKELPVITGTVKTQGCTIIYTLSFTTQWMYFQKDDRLVETTFIFSKDAFEIENILKEFGTGFSIKTDYNGNLNVSIKNKFISNDGQWSGETKLELLGMSIKFEQKYFEARIKNYIINAKIGLLFEAKIKPDIEPYDNLLYKRNPEYYWKEVLPAILIIGYSLVKIVVADLTVAASFILFMIEIDQPRNSFQGEIPMAIKVIQANDEKKS